MVKLTGGKQTNRSKRTKKDNKWLVRKREKRESQVAQNLVSRGNRGKGNNKGGAKSGM